MHRVVALESRLPVLVDDGPTVTPQADSDQLQQLLINVTRNAVDAAFETGGDVRAGWSHANGTFEAWFEDEGPGLQSTANLFVPFFTTKPGGSGTGFALGRQIQGRRSAPPVGAERSRGSRWRQAVAVAAATVELWQLTAAQARSTVTWAGTRCD
jgi:signal transduction histidine kinase